MPVTLPRHALYDPLNIAGREVHDPGPRRHSLVRFTQSRRALAAPDGVHVVDQPTGEFCNEIGAQRPGRIDIAERRDQVGHIRTHDALVAERLCEIDRLVIDDEFDATENDEI